MSDDNPNEKWENAILLLWLQRDLCYERAFTELVIFYSDWNVWKHETPSNFLFHLLGIFKTPIAPCQL